MAKLPHQSSGTVITAADHWNPLVDAINTEGDQLDDTNQRLAATNTDVGALQTRATNTETRLGTAETKITANTKSISDNASSSKQTTDALASRLSTVETRTTDSSTGNTALGTRVTALEAGGGSSGGGGGSGFAPQAVTLTQSANQSFSGGGGGVNAVIANWKVSGTQTGSLYTAGNTYVTIPANGFYMFTGTLVLAYNTSGIRVVYFTTSEGGSFGPSQTGSNVLGAAYFPAASGGGVASSAVPMPLACGAPMTAGQTVAMICWIPINVNTSTITGYGGKTVFSCVRVA